MAEYLQNNPSLWQALLPWPKPEHNKYHRGHTLVVGGSAKHAGAAKLAAFSALRTGSGLVTIVCNERDVPVYATTALSLMTETLDNWKTLLEDSRKNTAIIGPGAGVGKETCDLVLAALEAKKETVLDADALTSFADDPARLFNAIASPCVLTPHSGEFARLFSGLSINHIRLQNALQAATLSHAVVVLKGSDTVIAAPDGRAVINHNAPPELATAGTGDVLAGIIAGLLSQGMEVFAAACAAVWIHGEAAKLQGTGLISQDLPNHIGKVLQGLKIQPKGGF